MKVTAIAPWFGSKRNLAPEIAAEFGPHAAYWDLFCGSMATPEEIAAAAARIRAGWTPTEQRKRLGLPYMRLGFHGEPLVEIQEVFSSDLETIE